MFSIKRESGKSHVIIINDTLRGLQSPKGGFQEGPLILRSKIHQNNVCPVVVQHGKEIFPKRVMQVQSCCLAS